MKEQARNTDFHVHVATEGGTQPTPSRLRLTGQGRVYGEPFHLDGHVGAWGSGQQPSPVQVQFRLGDTRARMHGTLGQGPQRTDFGIQFAVQGQTPLGLLSSYPSPSRLCPPTGLRGVWCVTVPHGHSKTSRP